MTDSFDDLYSQIVQCEQRVEEKQRLMSELREQLQQSKEYLQRNIESQRLLENELVTVVDRHSELKLNQSSLKTREEVLSTQKETLQNEFTSLQQELTSLATELEREMVTFCQDVERESSNLDLTASGKQARKNKAFITLENLLATEQRLIQETADYTAHKERMAQLEGEVYCMQQSLSDQAITKQELLECVTQEEEKLKQLQEERQQASNAPTNGAEFIRLRSELRSMNTKQLEQQCLELQQHANSLQQQLCYRQQQQKRQQQLTINRQQQVGRASASVNNDYRGNSDNEWRAQQLKKTQNVEDDFFETDDDEDLTLLCLEMPPLEETKEDGQDTFRVCNRQKPVFKPT